MTISTFKRSEVVAGVTRTALYGPVPVGTTAVVFSGTFSNLDSNTSSDHAITLEVLNQASSYIPRLYKVPIPFGGTSKCPKTVLLAGEYLYVTADSAGSVQAVVDVLERS
jgi:hypothetical protein